MAQYFHPRSNLLVRRALWAVGGLVIVSSGGLWLGARSDYITGKGRHIEQPVPFPHDIHVDKLKLDCRYCHESVESSAFAGMPGAGVCMDCHREVWTGLNTLEPVRASYETRIPLAWRRVHDVPDYARFDHSIHIAKGVGCGTCHGRVDRMTHIRQTESLLMEWCLECHRQPQQYLRPREFVFDLDWRPPQDRQGYLELGQQLDISTPVQSKEELQVALVDLYRVRHKTSCSICHQ
jgi:hypothetical protein